MNGQQLKCSSLNACTQNPITFPFTVTLTCSFDVRCPIAGASTVDGHHRDSVECVLGEISEGVL